jgi:hypothetical protein
MTKPKLIHAEAPVEDVVVFGSIAIVVVRGRHILGRPGAAALAGVAAAPLARSGALLLLVLQVDAEAQAARTLCLGPLRVLPRPGQGELQGPRLELVEGGVFRCPLAGELLWVIRGLVRELARGVLYETARLLLRSRRGHVVLLLDVSEGGRRDAALLVRAKEAGTRRRWWRPDDDAAGARSPRCRQGRTRGR